MLYGSINEQIKSFNESFTYTDFYASLSQNTVDILNYTNKKAKQSISSMLEASEQNLEFDDKCIQCTNEITASAEKLIDSEFNRLHSKTTNIQNAFNLNKKRIMIAVLPSAKEYILYEKFFKPDLDILPTAINTPSENILMKMLGAKTTFTGEDLTTMQDNVIALVEKIKNQLEKNNSTIKKMIPKIENNSSIEFGEALDLKNQCANLIDAFKRTNMAYDEYLSNIQFILNEYAKEGTPEIAEKIQNSEPVAQENELEKSIDMERVYDTSGIQECMINIPTKIELINAQLENVSIKYCLASLNESSNSTNHNWFVSFILRLIEAVKKICAYIAQHWTEFVRKLKITIDRYGHWVTKYETQILNKIKTEKTFKDTVCEWKYPGVLTLSTNNLKAALHDIIPYITVGSSVSDYQRALDRFSHYDNSGKTNINIYNTIMNKEFHIKANGKINDAEKFARIISKYKKDPITKTLDTSDVQKYIKTLKKSRDRLTELNNTDKMKDINTIANDLAKDLERAKSMMNTGKYSEQECSIISRYYTARKTVLDVARQAAKDIYQINSMLITEMTHEAYMVLKNFLKSPSAKNESIEFSPNEYIELASLFESSSDVCMNSDLTQGGLISKNADINDFVSSPIPSNIMERIINLKLYPIAKLLPGTIILKSNIDDNTWVYNPTDNSLICQNTLNSIYGI